MNSSSGQTCASSVSTVARHTLGAILFLMSTACARPASVPPATLSHRAEPDFLDQRAPKAQLLFLGTFHFANPGLDTYKPRFTVDVTRPERQREIEGIVERLARFRPTKVAVEWQKTDRVRLDSLYSAYLAGTYRLGINEVYQIGFRLARRLGHTRVYPVDVSGQSPLTDEQAAKQAAALGVNIDSVLKSDPWELRYKAWYAYEDSLKTVVTLGEYLSMLNDPEEIRKGHGNYLVGPFKLARDDNYVGVDDVSRWYNRNLRIFSNIQQLTESPSERIALVIGAGHLPILRFLAQSSPEHRLVEVSEFLGARK